MIIVGIDPGKYGGVAIINTVDNTASVSKLPDDAFPEDQKSLFTYLGEVSARVYIEKPIILPHTIKKPCPKCHASIITRVMQQGILSSLISYGRLLGLIVACNIAYEEVDSAKWKKYFKLDKDKKKSIGLAKQFWPSLINEIKNHDGMAEALLLAEYGKRTSGYYLSDTPGITPMP